MRSSGVRSQEVEVVASCRKVALKQGVEKGHLEAPGWKFWVPSASTILDNDLRNFTCYTVIIKCLIRPDQARSNPNDCS